MSLATLFKTAAQKAFDAAGDVKKTLSLKHSVPGSYDPLTGERAANETVYSLSAIVSRWVVTSANSVFVRDGDLKATVLGSTLNIAAGLPDTATIDGVDYSIVRVEQDPVRATVSIQLRTK